MLRKIKYYSSLFLEMARKRPFPELTSELASSDKIAIITVNYNTFEQISLLLFSIFKNLGNELISDVVVVDNRSTDESLPLLQSLHAKGFIELIANDRQRYHGPGLNQAVNHLAVKVRKKLTAFRFLWILDSDTIVLRKDVIQRAFSYMQKLGSHVIGQFQDNGYPHISSVWIDPYRVWNCRVSPFTNDGWPSSRFYQNILQSKGLIHHFPFMKDNYILHLGESTLRQIYLQNDSSNELFQWASQYHSNHYHGNRNGKKIYDSVMALYKHQMEEAGDEGFVEILSSVIDYKVGFSRILNELPENR